MMIRKLFQGWTLNFVWEWRHWSKTIYFTPCHVGLEAGTYVGSYIELIVVILGVGFYLRWYPPTEGRKAFMNEMHAAMESVRKDFDMEEAT